MLQSLTNFWLLWPFYIEEEDSYYSENSENEVELKEVYKTLFKEFEKLREGRKQQINDLNSLHT
jgi:hypothetical protein